MSERRDDARRSPLRRRRRFRLKITSADGRLVYDNQMQAEESAAATTVLGGGRIVIHTKE